jgi:hypothetical protein
MTIAASPLGAQAEDLLARRFARHRPATKYIACFRAGRGRHIALTRQTKNDIYVWVERDPGAIEGVSIKNRDRPGQPYAPGQPRSSNLTNASERLGVAREAYYLKCDTLGALERLVDWYAAV